MTEPVEEWPTALHRLASNDYLLAFGQMTLAYNLLESEIHELFTLCAPLDYTFSANLAHRSNNRELIDLFTALVRRNEKEPTLREALLHCLKCYDICTENRNILMHVEIDVEEFKFRKRASKDASRPVQYEVPIPKLRLVAEQTGLIFVYAFDIAEFMLRKLSPSERPRAPALEQRELPGKPQKPYKLTPSELPKAGIAVPSQP